MNRGKTPQYDEIKVFMQINFLLLDKIMTNLLVYNYCNGREGERG